MQDNLRMTEICPNAIIKVKIGRDTEIESKEQANFLVPSVACGNNKHRTRKHESNFNQFFAGIK